MQLPIEPAILYFGTPVVLVSSLNEDGTANLAPMSSAWWLGWNCMMGFGARSKTPQNILRTRQCVLNLPSVAEVAMVNRLARVTGSNPVPEHKIRMGYRYEPDKFGLSGFTQTPSVQVAPPRVVECPVQLEAVLTAVHPMEEGHPNGRGNLVGLEVKIVRAHVDPSLRMEGFADRIDPVKWRPLIMSFCQFFGLGPLLHPSALAEIPESMYRRAATAPTTPRSADGG